MSKALLEVGGDEATETAKFCLMMDRFFDSLNVVNYEEGHKHSKEYRKPYKGKDDFRFKV